MPGPAFRRGESVALHPSEEEDIEFLQRLHNDPEVRSGLTISLPQTRHEAEQQFEQHNDDDTGVGLLVVPEGEEDPVGKVVVFDIDTTHGTAELAAWIDPAEQGNGYATEATRLIVGYAFEERRLNKLRARALVTNEPSRAVLEGVGFTLEGIQPEEKYVNGDHIDVARYAMLAAEWPPNAVAADRGER